MNVKPGDLAVQIHEGSTPENVGAFFDVKTACVCRHDTWMCEAKQPCMQDVSLRGRLFIPCACGESLCIPDFMLRPIRPSAPPVATPAPSKELERT